MNLWVFRDVYKKFTGHSGSNGCVITGGGLNDHALTRDLPIIFAPHLGPEITHEILHTIDPFFGKRVPQEAILEEFATFYRETYIPRVYTQTLMTNDGSGRRSEPTVSSREVFKTMPRLRETLKQDEYRNNYGKGFPSQELYDRKVDAIAETLMKLEQYLSKVDINKAILNAKSHEELLVLLDDCQQQKLST